MRQNRRKNHYGDRISRIVRDSMESDFAREAGGWVKSIVTEKPVVSICLGLAAGFALGMMIRRRA